MATGLRSYHPLQVARLRHVATFRGIIPFFAKLYAESLGAQVADGDIVGEGWRAKVKFRKVRIGSLELTEAEMSFDGDIDAIQEFLAKFRAKALRNAG